MATKFVELERTSSEGDIKKAYDQGQTIDAIAERTSRSTDEVLRLVFVDGEDGGVEDRRRLDAEIAEREAAHEAAVAHAEAARANPNAETAKIPSLESDVVDVPLKGEAAKKALKLSGSDAKVEDVKAPATPAERSGVNTTENTTV